MRRLFLSILLLSTFFAFESFAAKSLYLSYKKVPKKVYKNQKFEVVVKALVTTSSIDYLTSSFSNAKNIQVLNPKSKWRKISSDTYENRYFFKAQTKNFFLPSILVKVIKNGKTLDASRLSSPAIRYSEIAKGDERFSGIIADEIVLKAYKTKQYTNNDALTIVDIEGLNSNLEDFTIQDVQEQGVSNLKEAFPKQTLIYYFVTPVHQKKMVVTYYNNKTKSFKELTIPLILQNELVSTQTDLNPNDSSFEKYKKVAAVVLFVIFLALYLWKRKKFLLALTIICFIVSVLYLMPNKNAVVKKDSFIYILPTKNSTIFFKLENKQKVEILQKRNGFVKVLGIDNEFIGWVKEESLGKN